jgi:hypothetical protein
VHLKGFLQVTQSPDLAVECYAALRGQTQGQLTALDTLLMHAGSLRGQVDSLEAERVAIQLDNTTLGQDLNEMGETT